MTSPLPGRTARHHAGLTALLWAIKDRCGLTFSELAARTARTEDAAAVSASTLKRAAGGDILPQEHVVTAYARACGATAEEELQALKLWRAARAEQRGILATLHAPAVRSIRTPPDLDAALVAAYERAGAPALRVLQERASTDEEDGALLLPRTTLWRITCREARVATWEQCAAFLRGCGVHPRRMGPWREAWQRIHTAARAEPPEPAPATGRTTRGSWWSEMRLSLPLTLLTDGTWLHAPDRPAAYGPFAPAVVDQPGQQAGAAPTLSRTFAGLDPADQASVLAAGLTRLAVARGRARRNGTAPDTGIDAITVHDGNLVLLQSKHSGDTASGPPPGTGTAPGPALPPRPSGPHHRARQAAPA
ncbi:helix-turn-helix domain-containing protein [Streptomyces sp. NPDC048278]|uniref:helix-turn-helix domain-containing protein n=1 Tax=Streptomyces sp. NPDC048278 TaxID=3155809 RepID=UPI0034387D04